MEQLIKKLSDRSDLTLEECRSAIDSIMDGSASPVQTSSFLTALTMKGETVEEILGAAQAMRDRVTRIKLNDGLVFDNCGTGGDKSGTFNISTASAFVIAACGVTVAKHGNRSVSSKCGSADVLEALGVNLDLTPEQVGECIEQVGIGFLFAPKHHPAMKNVAPIRKELGIRTIFNLLGPLTNPAFATHQLIGVFSAKYVEPVARVASLLDLERIMVVHNNNGIDEVVTSGITRAYLAENGTGSALQLTSEKYGFEPCRIEDLKGGDAAANATILKNILDNIPGPGRDTVVFNSAAALFTAGQADSIESGVRMAAEAVASGAAKEKLENLVHFTKRAANAR